MTQFLIREELSSLRQLGPLDPVDLLEVGLQMLLRIEDPLAPELAGVLVLLQALGFLLVKEGKL
jgi:hypothetical protein